MNDYLTQDDVAQYGGELTDFAQRAALHALAPELQDIRNQNAELQRRLAKEARFRLDQQVAAAVPNYKEIDRDSNWHRWLLQHDALSGEVRQRLLNAAIQRGDANSVVAFFRQYQSGGGSTHAASPASGGRTRSASSGRQIYTREMIGDLYERRRKGEIAEVDWNRIEADIFDAQKTGRISGAYLTK